MIIPHVSNTGERQCGPNELWLPNGMHLDLEYPAADSQSLKNSWESLTGLPATASSNVLGVYTPPTAAVRAVASIDLCEVVRDTIVSIDSLSGGRQTRRGRYSHETWHSPDKLGVEKEFAVIKSMAQVVMNHGLVLPVENIDRINSIVSRWRSYGIFCVANTSTLAGCEQSTIKHFIAEYLPTCFDGIVFPRNHDGFGKVSKRDALHLLSNEAGIIIDELPRIHIDDTAHHIDSFLQHDINQSKVAVFMPLHDDNAHPRSDILCDSPLEAFIKSDAYFTDMGVLNHEHS